MIGVFDSGLGGLSVVGEILALDPGRAIRYLGDRAWAPYGRLTPEKVRDRSEMITDHLLAAGAEVVVIACNTASAVALDHLRRRHPGIPFVGMEPAVKPASTLTRTGTIGVLATPATFGGALYASVVDRFATGLEVIETICPGWVELVESPTDAESTLLAVARHVTPTVEAGADVLVLACTHYPFLRSAIETAAGPEVAIVDPGPAVARQVLRVADHGVRGPVGIEVTGAVDGVRDRIADLVGFDWDVRAVTLPDGVH